MLSRYEIEKGLHNGLWYIRERNFKYPMTSNDVWGKEVRRLIEKHGDNGIAEYGEDIHEIESWAVTIECEIATEKDILTALQIAKAEVIKFETEKVKQYGDKKCTCYQLNDWNFLQDEIGIYMKEVQDKNDTYSMTLVKYAIILEDLEK